MLIPKLLNSYHVLLVLLASYLFLPPQSVEQQWTTVLQSYCKHALKYNTDQMKC